jgi:hypothetical protein
MAPRFVFVLLSVAFAITIVLATVTTVKHLHHRADAAAIKSS